MMRLVLAALKQPITVAVMALLMLVLGGLSYTLMDVDIFPAIKLPVVIVVWTYQGLSAEDMERRIVWLTERATTSSVNDVEHIESVSMNGVAVIKVYFYPYANLGTAMGEVTAAATGIYRTMPTGTQLPLIFTYDAANVPVAMLNLSSDTLSTTQLFDWGINFLRPQLFTIPGFSSPPPLGGSSRSIMVNLNPDALYANGLSPADVANALAATNVVIPSGQVRIGDYTYNVDLNMSPEDIHEFNRLPIKLAGRVPVHVGDLAPISDSHQPISSMVRVNGGAATILLVIKHAGASTLDVIDQLKARIPGIVQNAPKGVNLALSFDQSIFVRAALREVVRESLIAAGLVALMALLFLGSARSMLIVIISIPLSILTAIVALKLSGQTLNIMTLGGLALAVGMLVDDATVEIENIHRNHAMGKPLLVAIIDGASQIATPTLVGTLSVCIVFFPVVLLSGVARYLFTPLAEAVVFAMLTSYMLSRTLVTTMAHHLLPQVHDEHHGHSLWQRFVYRFEQGFEHLGERYQRALTSFIAWRGFTLGVVILMVLASLMLIRIAGQDFFPAVDAGTMKLHLRAPSGTRIERTAVLVDQVEQAIRKVIPRDELSQISDNIGAPFAYALAFYQSDSSGEQDADVMIQLAPKHQPTALYEARIRRMLRRDFPQMVGYFQAADIVNQVLNFGLSAPLDVQVSGQNLNVDYAVASRLQAKLAQVPGLVDLRIPEALDYPALRIKVDRDRALELGATETEIAASLLTALSGNMLIQPTWWLDPHNGVNYGVISEVPKTYIDSLQDLGNLPVLGIASSTMADGAPPAGPPSEALANVATISHGTDPLMIAHTTAQRVIDLDLNLAGVDLGSATAAVKRAIAGLGKLPRGVRISVLGQSRAMEQSFGTLEEGIVLAVILVYLLMAANFQSWLEPLIIMTAIPGAFAGVLWALVLTGTTINVESLMGTIMAVGVGVANGNLLISFANDLREEGRSAVEAAIGAARVRLRPIIMTALAMILGMLPMALGQGSGSELNAPLGRAVIGGLLAATAMTLFVVPAVYSMVGSHRHSARERRAEVDAARAASTLDAL